MAQQQLFAGEQGLAVNKGLGLPRTRGEITGGFGGFKGHTGSWEELLDSPHSSHRSQTLILPWQNHQGHREQGRAGTIRLCRLNPPGSRKVKNKPKKLLLRDLKPLSITRQTPMVCIRGKLRHRLKSLRATRTAQAQWELNPGLSRLAGLPLSTRKRPCVTQRGLGSPQKGDVRNRVLYRWLRLREREEKEKRKGKKEKKQKPALIQN